MSDAKDDILDHLAFAVRRDAEKGGAGLRSTRQVAERAGISPAVARRRLGVLADGDLVDQVEGGDWRITELGLASLEEPDQATHSPVP